MGPVPAHISAPRQAVVIRFGSLGDIVLATPVLDVLKKRYPDLRITFVTKRVFASLVAGHPAVDRLVLLGEAEDGGGVAGLFRLAARLRDTVFDLVVDLHAVPRSYLLCLLLKKKKIVRYDKERRLRTRLVRQGRQGGRSRPVSEKYLACLPGGFPTDGPLPALYPTAEEKQRAAALLGNTVDSRPLIALHPGAAWPEKRWPADRFRELMEARREAWRFVLVGEAGDAPLIGDAGRAAGAVNAAGRTTPGELAALLARCRVLVCGDTGPMHVAGAVGCGVAALFGPTHPVLGFAPQHPATRVLCRDEPCSPCSLHGRTPCRFGDRHCLTGIAVSDVIGAVEELLTEA